MVHQMKNETFCLSDFLEASSINFQDFPDYAKNFVGKKTYVIERAFLDYLKSESESENLDPRWTAIAKTHFEIGFMAFRKAYKKVD